MIETIGLTKNYGDFTAIKNLSFKVEAGSIYGLAGYNGAGKTTLLKCVAGILQADEGKVLIDGGEAFDSNRRERLFFAADELMSPLGFNMRRLAHLYAGYHPHFSFQVFDKLCKAFDLNTRKALTGFSKGMRRQAEMIYALSSMPKILLLDEAFDGLDPQKRALCKDIFIQYIAEHDCTMIISSHNLDDLQRLCDRFGLMDGKTLKLDSDSADIGKNYSRFVITLKDENTQVCCPAVRIKRYRRHGTQLTFEACGNLNELRQLLASLDTDGFRELNLTVDEIFLFEMEDEKNDISKIFTA
ncbi:MAG: ABC transporter ATP-binding protein [Oscillospiraceae bacterium]|nr:ABC transporter ATP-binding protein [Oscillospiraceae bacterium]